MKKLNYSLVLVAMIVVACLQKEKNEPFVNNRLNKAWLDQQISNSDSTYTRRYGRSDFVTAAYYINKKDSTLCQVMRDSANEVRQVIIEKAGVRTFYAQYYPGGQASGIWQLNNRGQLEGEAKLFYPDGTIMSQGKYQNGLYTGKWEYYDNKMKLVKDELYDSNGAVVETKDY